MNIPLPCFSNAPDREHDAVVLVVDASLLEQLAARRRAFDSHKLTDQALYAHEYEGGPVHYLHLDDSEYLDAPEGPVLMSTHLEDLALIGSWRLEPAPFVYLKVVAEGFFYTWDGRREKHGPSEIYETEVFDLESLEALCRTPMTNTPTTRHQEEKKGNHA